MSRTTAITDLAWDWFTSVGGAHVLDHDGVGGAADWHLLFSCSIDRSSSVPTPGVRPGGESHTVGTVATGVACTCGHFTSETLFTPSLLPFADLLAAAAEAEADAGAPQVFLVTANDLEGCNESLRVFATEDAADAYAAQFTRTTGGGLDVTVTPYAVDTDAPDRVTNYLLRAMYSTPSAAAAARSIGTLSTRPHIEQFDADDEDRLASTERPVTTSPVKVDIIEAPSVWRVIKAYGTDEAAVRAGFDAAVAQVVADARADA